MIQSSFLPRIDVFQEKEVKQMGCGPKIGKRKSKVRRSTKHTSNNTSESSLVMPRVPQNCSNCGASLNSAEVKWVGPTSMECPYCESILQVKFEKIV
jgi:predicted Zn-ribbon and HTH transcriptional regulator